MQEGVANQSSHTHRYEEGDEVLVDGGQSRVGTEEGDNGDAEEGRETDYEYHYESIAVCCVCV